MQAPEEVVVTQTEIIRNEIPIQEHPKPVDFPPVTWYVVTESNIDEFMQRIQEDSGNTVFMAISPKGYENLAIGIGELRRYVNQQKEIIVYYEDAISGGAAAETAQ